MALKKASTTASKKKRARRSLFFWCAFTVIIVFLFLVTALLICTNPGQLFLVCLYAVAQLFLSRAMPLQGCFIRFVKLHCIILPLSLFLLLSADEGRIFTLGPFSISARGLQSAPVLYLKLSALFWFTRSYTAVFSPCIIQKGLSILLAPLALLGLRPEESAAVLYNAVILMPELLSELPGYLKSGHKGLAKLFGRQKWFRMAPVQRVEERFTFYEWLLTGSALLLGIALLLGGK